MSKLILMEQDERDGVVWHMLRNEITACKNCKYMKVHGWNPKKEVSTCHYHCELWNHAVDDCDFCSRGVKEG